MTGRLRAPLGLGRLTWASVFSVLLALAWACGKSGEGERLKNPRRPKPDAASEARPACGCHKVGEPCIEITIAAEKDRFRVGDEVRVKAKVRNVSKQALLLQCRLTLGVEGYGRFMLPAWFRVKRGESELSYRFDHPNSWIRGKQDYCEVGPGGEIRGEYLLSRYYDVDRAGVYEFVMHYRDEFEHESLKGACRPVREQFSNELRLSVARRLRER